MSVTQSEAVISCVLNLCTEKKIKHEPFVTIYRDVLTDGDKSLVADFITQGLVKGEITMTEKSKIKFKDDVKALRRYVVGLVNDRLRKAKKLNGNTTYQHQEPGKLKNARDPELKALMQTLEIVPAEHKADVQVEIDRRKKELDAAKKTTVAIDLTQLSPELRKMLGYGDPEAV